MGSNWWKSCIFSHRLQRGFYTKRHFFSTVRRNAIFAEETFTFTIYSNVYSFVY